MAEKKENKWAGIIVGPIISCCAVVALWKNETRFDYYRAAAATVDVQSPGDATEGQLISLTGPMDQKLTMQGKYVESFTGYLQVRRRAEIYAWDREEDSDDGVTWTLRWMGSVEGNSRNSGVSQQLSSESFLPPQYEVGELPVESNMIEFVDSSETIQPSTLNLQRDNLKISGEYFHLYKHKPRNLGDERVSYVGIPVPSTATYFGKFESQRGIADQSNRRDGMINQIIQDTGILHHIVAGERSVALATMKAHIARVKWIVRGIGTVCVVFGFVFLFSTVLGFLYHIPVIGGIAESGVFLLALAVGLPIAFITIVSSYLVAHPLLLGAIIALIIAGIYILRRRGKSSQDAMKAELDSQYGHRLDAAEIKELEFLELAQLALADAEFGDKEEQFLRAWARKHGWQSEKYDQMIERAKRERSSSGPVSNDEHLMNLIRLALADGSLSQYEIRSIRTAARNLGYDDSTIRELMNRARQTTGQNVSA